MPCFKLQAEALKVNSLKWNLIKSSTLCKSYPIQSYFQSFLFPQQKIPESYAAAPDILLLFNYFEDEKLFHSTPQICYTKHHTASVLSPITMPAIVASHLLVSPSLGPTLYEIPSSEHSWTVTYPVTTHLLKPISVCWKLSLHWAHMNSSSIPHELLQQQGDGKRGHNNKKLSTILKPQSSVLVVMTSRNITDLNF